MVNVLPLLLSFFVLQARCKAAPSEIDLVIPEEGPKLDSVRDEITVHSTVENESENSQRQKRYYDYSEFGFPTLPSNFPYADRSQYSKRDESQNTALYGADDALTLIFKRLQGILSNVRLNSQTLPHQASIPAFIPFFYIPQGGCSCTTNSQVPLHPVNSNDKTPSNEETTTPALPNRFSDLDDTQQNSGTVSGNESNINIKGDGNRPISFTPIIPQTPIDIPVPPVEHGSVQAGAQPQSIPTTTFKPAATRPAIGSSRIPYIAPTVCDAAILSCCLLPQITPNCFAQRGCPDPSRYGKPCDPEVLLNLIKKVDHYVRQRNY